MPDQLIHLSIAAMSPVPAGIGGSSGVDPAVSSEVTTTPGLVTDSLSGDLVFFSVMFVLAVVMTITGTAIIARRHRRRQREYQAWRRELESSYRPYDSTGWDSNYDGHNG